MNFGCESPTSSPPTPPSPLPISFGPGNRRYSFSASSTPSPPFSLPPSTHTSAENLPLLHKTLGSPNVPSVFSLDRQDPQELESNSTCLKDLAGWNGLYKNAAVAVTGFLESSKRHRTAQGFKAVVNTEFVPKDYYLGIQFDPKVSAQTTSNMSFDAL